MRTRTRAIARSSAALLLPLATIPSAGCVSFGIHNANLMGGQRYYDKTTFEPVDVQPAIGVAFDTYKLTNGLGFEIGALFTQDDAEVALEGLGTADVSSQNYEGYLGVRKTFLFRDEPFYPYIGGGLTGMHTRLSLTSADGEVKSSDTTGGIYVHAGIYWNFLGSAILGLDLRRVFATSVDLLDVDTDVDYTQVLVTIGFTF